MKKTSATAKPFATLTAADLHIAKGAGSGTLVPKLPGFEGTRTGYGVFAPGYDPRDCD